MFYTWTVPSFLKAFFLNYNQQLQWLLSSRHILQTFDLTVPPNKSKTTYDQFSNAVSYQNMNTLSSHTTYKCEW